MNRAVGPVPEDEIDRLLARLLSTDDAVRRATLAEVVGGRRFELAEVLRQVAIEHGPGPAGLETTQAWRALEAARTQDRIRKLLADLADPGSRHRADHLTAISRESREVWVAACRILRDRPLAEAFPTLLRWMADETVAVRRAAAHAVPTQGASRWRLVPGLLALLADSDPLVRRQAWAALREIPEPDLGKDLEQIFTAGELWGQRATAPYLPVLAVPELEPMLVKLSEHPTAEIRQGAIEARRRLAAEYPELGPGAAAAQARALAAIDLEGLADALGITPPAPPEPRENPGDTAAPALPATPPWQVIDLAEDSAGPALTADLPLPVVTIDLAPPVPPLAAASEPPSEAGYRRPAGHAAGAMRTPVVIDATTSPPPSPASATDTGDQGDAALPNIVPAETVTVEGIEAGAPGSIDEITIDVDPDAIEALEIEAAADIDYSVMDLERASLEVPGVTPAVALAEEGDIELTIIDQQAPAHLAPSSPAAPAATASRPAGRAAGAAAVPAAALGGSSGGRIPPTPATAGGTGPQPTPSAPIPSATSAGTGTADVTPTDQASPAGSAADDAAAESTDNATAATGPTSSFPRTPADEALIATLPGFLGTPYAALFKPGTDEQHIARLRKLLGDLVAFLNLTFLQSYLFFARRTPELDRQVGELIEARLRVEQPLSALHRFSMALRGVQQRNFFTFVLARNMGTDSDLNPLLPMRELWEYLADPQDPLEETLPIAVNGVGSVLGMLKIMAENPLVMKVKGKQPPVYANLSGPVPAVLPQDNWPEIDLPEGELIVLGRDRSEALGLWPFFAASGRTTVPTRPTDEDLAELKSRLELT